MTVKSNFLVQSEQLMPAVIKACYDFFFTSRTIINYHQTLELWCSGPLSYFPLIYTLRNWFWVNVICYYMRELITMKRRVIWLRMIFTLEERNGFLRFVATRLITKLLITIFVTTKLFPIDSYVWTLILAKKWNINFTVKFWLIN